MSKYINLQENIEMSQIEEASKIIKKGGTVVFPTETVYGIGASGFNPEAVKKIYEAKGRKFDKPLILLISDIKMLDEIAENVSEVEEKLINAFWPGPLTLVLPKKDCVPDIVTGGSKTVGIRMTSGKVARKLIDACGFPITAPSANISGKPTGTKIKEIIKDLGDKVDCIIDCGDSQMDIESTVVKVIDGIPHILRQGKITNQQIVDISANYK